MSKKVSKEFIEAMQGVLNGEKWQRKSFFNYIFKDKFDDIVIGNKDYIGDCYNMDTDDMTATDWVKVE